MIPNAAGRAGGPVPLGPLPAGPAPSSGFVSGTSILTGDGSIDVEYLCAGDRIITRDAGMTRLRDVQSGITTTEAVAVAPGAIGPGEGPAPLILPATQRVLIRDWRAPALFGTASAVVPVAILIDGEFIRRLGPRRMALHRLWFDEPHIVYAGGVEAVGAARPVAGTRFRAA